MSKDNLNNNNSNYEQLKGFTLDSDNIGNSNIPNKKVAKNYSMNNQNPMNNSDSNGNLNPYDNLKVNPKDNKNFQNSRPFKDPIDDIFIKDAPQEQIKGFTVDISAVNKDAGSVVINDATDVTTVSYEDDEEEEIGQTKFWSSPILWIILLILTCSGVYTINTLIEVFNSNSILGFVTSGLVVGVFLLCLWSIYKELSSVWYLRENDQNRAKVVEIIENGNGLQAIRMCKDMATFAHVHKSKAYKDFESKVKEHYSPLEVFQVYERTVLKYQDEKAKSIIIKRSAENGVVVALSPMAWLDMMLTLARSIRMIRELSLVYGFRCGYWGRMQLYKRVIKNLIFIGAADLATDAVIDVLGASMTAKISAQVGQGVAAGIYSTRLGYMATKALRPLPLSKEVLSLGELRKELLLNASITKVLNQNR